MTDRDVVDVLKSYRDDPMWAHHAEVNKGYLDAAINEITTLRKKLADTEAELSWAVETYCY